MSWQVGLGEKTGGVSGFAGSGARAEAVPSGGTLIRRTIWNHSAE